MIVDILCIKKLLMTNNFSEIFLDLTKENILKLLGNPIDSSPQRKNNKEILSYGVLQIYLFNSLVKVSHLIIKRLCTRQKKITH